MSEASNKRLQIAGWAMFIVSALFFIAASARAGDALGLIGALFFLVACFVFFVPLVVRRPPGGAD